MEAYVFYSHFEYSDIWPLMFGQSEKHLKGKKKYLITNQDHGEVNHEWTVIKYDEKKSYQERVWKSLEQIKEEIVIFHHEDMFLFSEPKWEVMNKLLGLVKQDKVDVIKLIKASYDNSAHEEFEKNIYYNPKNLLFCIQPTIIKREKLIKIFKYTKGNSMWQFEVNSNSLVDFMNYSSFYYHEGIENKRGMYHWDSQVYPYVATAVVKGKWDYEIYPKILSDLHKKYNIDPNKRGKNV